MLRPFDCGLLKNGSYVTAVNTFQRELTFRVSGLEHVAMTEHTR